MSSVRFSDGDEPAGASAHPAVLVPGDTCWRIERAGRASVLVDGESYFGALADALERARHRIILIGWDFHSRVRLRRDGRGALPDELAALLDALARRRRGLDVYVLEWDFSLLYLPEREALRAYRFAARTHRRVRFRFDSEHPVGASHHQKIAVIDDAVAFSGGLDLTSARWDTRAHAAENPHRVDPDGRSYPPFHDIQMAVDGDAAAALGELARERWRAATGHALDPVDASHDPWPESLEADLRDVPVGIARTLPAHRDTDAVHEVEKLYLESIRSARRSIYIENQYLTARGMAECVAARLREPDGPEVMIVLPERCSGWLEETSMGVLRDQFLRLLRDADEHDRLRLYHPRVPGLGPGQFVNVHSKVMIVDDRLLRVGSANLANRSMGLDSECDLAIEAQTAEHARAIGSVRDGLVAEHLGVEADAVAREREAAGSLLRAVEALRGGDRTLVPVVATTEEWTAELAERFRVFDPETPLSVEDLIPQMGEIAGARRLSVSTVRAIALAIFVALALGLWRFTPLSELVTPGEIASLGARLSGSAAGIASSVLLIGLASLLLVPVTGMIVACGLVFPPATAFGVALAGATLGAALGYLLGSGLWRDAVQRLAGQRFRSVSRRLASRGILATAAVRLVPVAPFGLVNLVAGASHVGLRDFLAGTVLAMSPGCAVLVFASDRVSRAIAHPDAGTLIAAIAAVAVAVGAGIGLRRWAFGGGRSDERDGND